jgi:hypothetical protein
MSQWKVATPIIPKAAQEVAFLFENAEVKAEIRRILALLASQEDPRKPTPDAELIVEHLDIHTPGWYRVKVMKYWIRVAFRLLVVRGGILVELGPFELPDSDERYIDITYG